MSVLSPNVCLHGRIPSPVRPPTALPSYIWTRVCKTGQISPPSRLLLDIPLPKQNFTAPSIFRYEWSTCGSKMYTIPPNQSVYPYTSTNDEHTYETYDENTSTAELTPFPNHIVLSTATEQIVSCDVDGNGKESPPTIEKKTYTTWPTSRIEK